MAGSLLFCSEWFPPHKAMKRNKHGLLIVLIYIRRPVLFPARGCDAVAAAVLLLTADIEGYPRQDTHLNALCSGALGK
jgi:hypothetical protein